MKPSLDNPADSADPADPAQTIHIGKEGQSVINVQTKPVCQLCSLPGFLHITNLMPEPDNIYSDGWLCHLHAPDFLNRVIDWNPRTGRFVAPNVDVSTKDYSLAWQCVECPWVFLQPVHVEERSTRTPIQLQDHQDNAGHQRYISRVVEAGEYPPYPPATNSANTKRHKRNP